MKLTLILLLLLAVLSIPLTGCATISDVVPSLKYCDRVIYDREGRAFTLHAECTLPGGVEAPL